MGMCEDETYAIKLGPYMAYWENILGLSNPLPTQNSTFLEGFWPFDNWRSNHVRSSIPPIIDANLEDLVIAPYCGPKNMRPSLKTIVYTLFRDLGLGDFVLMKPAELELYPMWMGRVENEVVKDEHSENFRHLHIQWWVLVKKGARNDR